MNFISEVYLEEFTLFGSEVIEEGKYIRITNFPAERFKRDLKYKYKTSKVSNVFDHAFLWWGKGKITIHRFFLPEFVYLLTVLPYHPVYHDVRDKIFERTWMMATIRYFPSRVNTNLINELNYKLNPYQKDFITLYEDKKQKFLLNGYILAFEQGLGKTFTSLALMHGLSKDAIIIVAPKSTLLTVWSNEINNVFNKDKEIWLPFDKPKPSRFYIVNYESIDKLDSVLPYISRSKNIGIIVDECHNFRNTGAKRVQNLNKIAKITNCRDILLMSGTPIKALGTEMIPTLELIDPFFDDESKEVFKKAFGLNVPVALDILKNRLGIMMHRKMKKEVLNLPEKYRKEIKIRIPNGDQYTLNSVKEKVLTFIGERKAFYTQNMYKYEDAFQQCLLHIRSKIGSLDPDFAEYNRILMILRKSGYNRYDQELVRRVAWANNYEKEVLRPILTPELRKLFDKSKAAVKYVDLKIMGEVIGGLLTKLRVDMFREMIKNSPTCAIINDSEKKTVCFTTYTDVLREADSYIRTKCKKDPVLVFGETSGNIKQTLDRFRMDETANPLIATIQTLSTGVTLTEANSVIFINKPWRDSDMSQAEDRVHRIGQDTDVYIYSYTLDTGGSPNLSTRMDDIIAWSKEMFEGIVGKEGTEEFEKLKYNKDN